MTVLSTGQNRRPELGRKLRLFTNTKFIGKQIKGASKRAVSATLNKAREATAFGAGNVLDAFLGEWAGDWARNKAYKEEGDEKKRKIGDYVKIFRSEVADLLGKYDHKADMREALAEKREKEKQKKESKKKEGKPEETVVPQSTTVAQVQGMGAIGVQGLSDLEHLLAEMKKTSEDELLKYIESNDIKDEKLINELIEATHAANNEIEKGLRKQFKVEFGNSKTLERVAAATEGIHQEIIKQSQDIYGASQQTVQPVQNQTQQTPPAAPQQEQQSGGLGLGDMLGKFKGIGKGLGKLKDVGKFLGRMPKLAGAGSLLLGAAPLAAMYGVTKMTESGGYLDQEGLKEGGVIDSVSKFFGGNGTKADAEKTSVEKLNEDTSSSWWEFGKKDRKIKEIKDKLERGDKYSPEEAEVLKKNLGMDVPAENIEKRSVAPEPVKSVQKEQSEAMKQESAKLSENKEKPAAPLVVNAPTVAGGGSSGGSSSESFNFSTMNSENTHRRLNDKSLSLAYI